MKIEIGSVDFLDEFEDGASTPATSHCIIEIGESRSEGFDLFFANVSNRQWARKNLDRDETGLWDAFLIVDRLGESEIRGAIQNEFGNREYSDFEEFVERAKPFLRWEFEGYQR